MADDDDFDIDIYGDEGPEFVQEPTEQIQEDVQHADSTFDSGADGTNVGLPPNEAETEPVPADQDQLDFGGDGANDVEANYQQSTYQEPYQQPYQQQDEVPGSANVPPQQGTKREPDDSANQPINPNATAALKLGDLQWFVTEDDVRGWINQCEHEDELKELTWNESKLNGKSKG